MGRKARRAVGLLQLALAPSVAAQGGVAALFPPRPTGYVTDLAGVVDEASARTITLRIEQLRQETGAEIAVVTLPTIGEYAAVDVAVAIGRTWGVGAAAEIGSARRNAGAVVLLVPKRAGDPNSGQIFIASGQGLEGIVTDATAGRIRDRMGPDLSAARYGPGLITGVEALADVVTRGLGSSDTESEPESPERRRIPLAALIIGLVILVVVISAIREAMRESVAVSAGGRRRRRNRVVIGGWGGGFGGGGFGGGGGGGGGFGGFGGGGGFSGGGAGGRF